jgi:hypothetical protein
MALEPIAPDLWELRHEVSLPGGVHMPVRMTIVRHPNGHLSLISPVPIDDASAAELRALGEVRHLISPSALHHLFLVAARERFPVARVYAPPGVVTKQPRLAVDSVFTPDGADQLPVELSARLLEGATRAGEVCLFHAPSRSLIVADLVFNIQHYRGLGTGLVLRLGGTRHRLAASRAWRLLRDDPQRLRASVERVLEWDFDRLIVGHGEIVPADARPALLKGLGFLLTV